MYYNINQLLLIPCVILDFLCIHPFSDGNGRTARLWQNIILSKWKEIFEYVPIESQIKKYQNDYYKAIHNCNLKGESTEFIEFMLKMIDEVLDTLIEGVGKQINHISIYVKKLLENNDIQIHNVIVIGLDENISNEQIVTMFNNNSNLKLTSDKKYYESDYEPTAKFKSSVFRF